MLPCRPLNHNPYVLALANCCLFCAGACVEQEDPEYSRTMLSKLSKQQQLLLQELERTKRRLREEIWAREQRTATTSNALPADSADPLALWSNRHTHDPDHGRYANNALGSPSSYQSNKRSSHLTNGGKGQNAAGGARLKRSRVEAGMSLVENPTTTQGIERLGSMKPEEKSRAPPSTRIDMLPVMSSTGE